MSATVLLLGSGCARESGFPVVLANPVPRPDTPLSPEQVRQATEDLISDRDHLTAQATGEGASKTPNATGSIPPGAATKKKKPLSLEQAAATGYPQNAGAANRP